MPYPKPDYWQPKVHIPLKPETFIGYIGIDLGSGYAPSVPKTSIIGSNKSGSYPYTKRHTQISKISKTSMEQYQE
jgi:hypothetical protein